jgi:hypothetical protein
VHPSGPFRAARPVQPVSVRPTEKENGKRGKSI